MIYEVDNLNMGINAQLPIITITKEAPKAAVCKIFENVNTGGVPLNVFELLTASFASEDYELKKDWDSIFSNLARFRVFCDGRSQGDRIENTIFLQALTLVVTYYRKQNTDESSLKPNEKPPAISCKREAILDLKLKEYTDNKESIVEAFINVAGFLHSQKIFSHKDLPYNTQLTPLVAIFSILRNHIKSQSVIEKISRWFWCGIIGEFYSGPVETQFSRDTHEVVMWIKNNDQEPSVIRNINFRPSRLVELRSRNSAVYKGINALLMKEGAADFITGNAIDEHIFIDDTIDIHHIFPKDWCEKQNIKKEIYNSILNKTPLSSYTNRIISNKPPSKYLEIIKNKHLNDSTEKLNTILDSHLVDPEIIKKDEFYLTMKKRALKLIEKIEISIGKEIIKDFQFVDNYSSEENEDDY